MIVIGTFIRAMKHAPMMCAVLAAVTGYPVAARAAPVQATPAYQFVNRIGVATHFTWARSPYRTAFDQAKVALGELGIRHIRDASGNKEATAFYRDLRDAFGLKLCAVVDARTGSGANTHLDPSQIPEMLGRIKSELGVSMIKAIEGPNEYNLLEREYGRTDWAPELRAYQAELRRRVKADPDLRALPVLAPSMADPMQEGYYRQVGDLTGSIDRGNAHVYPNWLSWEQKIVDVMPFSRIVSPTQPLWVSETGWHSAFNSGAQWVSEDVQLKYLTRAMATFVSTPGIERAYLYQLIDPYYDPGKTTPVSQFGLLDYGMNRRNTFYAVRNMMHVMCDNPLTFPPQSLRYTLSGNLTDVRTQLFQKSNRSFYMMLWVNKQSFKRGQEVLNPPQAMKIQFEQGIRQARVFLPADQADGIRNSNLPKRTLTSPTAIDLNVTDAVTILEVTPAGIALPAVKTACSFKAI